MTITKNLSTVFLFTIFLISSFPVLSNGNTKISNEVFLVAQIDIKDYQAYMEKYGKPVTQLLIDAGAEILVASRKGEILEGEWSGNWTVITKFPNVESAKSWYNSKEYSLFKEMRVEELINSGNIILLPSLN